MYNIKGKTVFITGGATGIGLETVHALLKKGAFVTVYSLSFKNTPEYKFLQKNKNTLWCKGTITSVRGVKNAIEKTIKKFGSIDVLINNASIAQKKEFIQTTQKDWDAIINTNIKGTLNVTQQVLRVMKKQKYGIIANISSGAGLRGIENLSLYSLTKAALINLSQSLSKEIKGDGVEVVTITPGSTATTMFATCFPGEKPHHTPEQIAEIIIHVIEKKITPDDRLIVDVFKHTH